MLVAVATLGVGVMFLFFTEKCFKSTSPEKAERDRRRFKRYGLFLLPAGLILLGYYLLGGGLNVLASTPRQQARRVIRECMTAVQELDNSPAGFARAEEFVRHIRAIDTRGAPKDLVDALHADADALERSLVAARQGKDTTEPDEQAAAAKERFAAMVRKYW